MDKVEEQVIPILGFSGSRDKKKQYHGRRHVILKENKEIVLS